MGFGVLDVRGLARPDCRGAADGWALPTSLPLRLLADRPQTRPHGPQTGGADLLPAARNARPFLDAPSANRPRQTSWAITAQKGSGQRPPARSAHPSGQ